MDGRRVPDHRAREAVVVMARRVVEAPFWRKAADGIWRVEARRWWAEVRQVDSDRWAWSADDGSGDIAGHGASFLDATRQAEVALGLRPTWAGCDPTGDPAYNRWGDEG